MHVAMHGHRKKEDGTRSNANKSVTNNKLRYTSNIGNVHTRKQPASKRASQQASKEASKQTKETSQAKQASKQATEAPSQASTNKLAGQASTQAREHPSKQAGKQAKPSKQAKPNKQEQASWSIECIRVRAIVQNVGGMCVSDNILETKSKTLARIHRIQRHSSSLAKANLNLRIVKPLMIGFFALIVIGAFVIGWKPSFAT